VIPDDEPRASQIDQWCAHVGDPITGGWCETCNLPSLIRIPVWLLRSSGVTLWQIIEACDEHGGHKHLPGNPDLLRFPE
jgi:hypothetical protein